MKVLISILFFIIANNSFAEDMRYYDIEVVVIENFTDEAKNSEIWPLQVNLIQPEKTVQLGEPFIHDWLPKGVDLRSSYKVLGEKSYQLTKEVEKISKSKTQRVIFHTAWRQPGLDKNQALPIHFKREILPAPVMEDVAKNAVKDENNLTQNIEAISSFDDTENKPSPSSILEGVLRVTLARYLHLEAELTYQNKIPEITDSDNPFSVLDNENERNEIQKQGVIHLKQKRRRIRSNELHYVDHPVLGILIHITPYKKAEEVASENRR